MAILSSALGILAGLVSIAKKWMGMKERKEFRKAGANEEVIRQLERSEDARKKMADVKPPGDGDTTDSLRDGKF